MRSAPFIHLYFCRRRCPGGHPPESDCKWNAEWMRISAHEKFAVFVSLSCCATYLLRLRNYSLFLLLLVCSRSSSLSSKSFLNDAGIKISGSSNDGGPSENRRIDFSFGFFLLFFTFLISIKLMGCNDRTIFRLINFAHVMRMIFRTKTKNKRMKTMKTTISERKKRIKPSIAKINQISCAQRCH